MPTYIRVKDLPNAATSPAADDFILLSGAANGARRISRADFLAAVAGFYTSDPSTYKLATLDAGNKVLVSQLPSSAFSYQGTWAASTNTPTLANGTGTGGDTYYASDSGSVDFGAGSISFLAGDAVVYDGSVWQKVPDVVNLLDGKGTLDEAKATLEIPDVGSNPDEVSLNGMLGSMAYQSAEAVSVAKAEVESTTGTATTQALTVTDGTDTNFVVREDGQTIVGGTISSVSKFGSNAKGLTVRAYTSPVLALNDTENANYVGYFAQNGTDTYLANYTAGNLYLGTNATTRVTIDSSGNITHKVGDQGANYDLTCNNHGAFGGSAVVDSRIRSENIGSSNAYASNLVFYTNNTSNVLTEAARFSEAGHLEFPSGQGIDFGSGGASSLLDDYERGTTAPTDASGAGLTLAGVGCNYVKIGSQVTAWVTVTYPTTSDTSTARIGNLPFAIGSSDIDRIGGFVASQDTGLSVSVLGTTGTGQVTFRKTSGAPYANSELSGKFIWFCFIYDVS